MVMPEFLAGVGATIAARQGYDAGDCLMGRESIVEIRDRRNGELDHYLDTGRQGVEFLCDLVTKNGLSLLLGRAFDQDLGLDDWDEAVAEDLLSYLELLLHDCSDAGPIGVANH